MEIEINTQIGLDLFKSWTLIPGVNEEGKFIEQEFFKWVNEAYKAAEEVNRVNAFENYLADIIIRYANSFPSNNFLPTSMLDLLEQREKLRQSIPNSISNFRGATWRGSDEGGEQERVIVNEYKKLATKLKKKYPNVSIELLRVADQIEQLAKIHDYQVELNER